MASITINNGVAVIGADAFEFCPPLTSISIPASVINIGALPFQLCNNLTAINVDAANPAYSSVGGVLLDKAKTTVIEFPAGKAGVYAVPGSVTKIDDGAFYSSLDLTSLTLPNGVTTIASQMFAYCNKLASVTLGTGVTSIGTSAFLYCTSLTGITIPKQCHEYRRPGILWLQRHDYCHHRQ